MKKNSKIRESKGVLTFRCFNNLFMVFLILVTLYPMLYVIFASFSDSGAFMRHTGVLLSPINPTLLAYKTVFKDPMIVKGYINTIMILFFGVSLNVFMTSITAYALTRKGVLWLKCITTFITLTMVLRGGMIPRYIVVGQVYNLENNILSLILPAAISTYNLIIMKTSISSIPHSLEESAQLDGAGHLRVLWSIIIPLSLPVLSVIILYYAVGHWNSWFDAMMFMRDREKFPLQLVLREVLLSNETSANMTAGTGDVQGLEETIKYAVIVIATVPILLVYPFLQKYFVKGTMVGAVKE